MSSCKLEPACWEQCRVACNCLKASHPPQCTLRESLQYCMQACRNNASNSPHQMLVVWHCYLKHHVILLDFTARLAGILAALLKFDGV